MSSEGAVAMPKDRNGSESKRCDQDEGIKQLIPHDIVSCVLLRLPAMSIGRFRCVCRRWRSLTHDARFIDEHRRLGGASGSHRLVAFEHLREKTMIERLSIYEVGPNCDEIEHRFAHFKFDELAGTDFYTFSNPAAGLIIVLDLGIMIMNMFLLNLITGEISQLPSNLVTSDTFGLGFDASSGAYKLARFDCVGGTIRLTVLTLGVGSWRHVCDVPLVVRSPPVFLHGTLYWLADPLTLDHRSAPTGLCILAFDVEHETLRSIPAPKISTSDLDSETRLYLLNFEGHMCIGEVFKFVPEGKNILEEAMSARLWMLTDHHEWKPHLIDISLLVKQFHAFRVIDIRGGQVLMQTQDAIYSYDLHCKNLRRVCCGDFQHALGVITESLVSPRDLISMWST